MIEATFDANLVPDGLGRLVSEGELVTYLMRNPEKADEIIGARVSFQTKGDESRPLITPLTGERILRLVSTEGMTFDGWLTLLNFVVLRVTVPELDQVTDVPDAVEDADKAALRARLVDTFGDLLA